MIWHTVCEKKNTGTSEQASEGGNYRDTRNCKKQTGIQGK